VSRARGDRAQPVGNAGAPVVADGREAVVTELGHQLDELLRHLALGVPLTPRPAGWRLRDAVPTQIRGDDAMERRQPGGDPMPARVRLRKPVQQEQGWPRASQRNDVARLPDGTSFFCEAGQRDRIILRA
jgi:hypothetical protein